ncbi:class I SAM-dependent methyltransferase [Bremerella sp. T1]|uniref:class I SAM-dependent methyltransferase n=1 Tax=Bremerella sp. TYQ1 TaxID=3119568 RepID=UPI001CCF6EA3|nr:methyltransferase domain-containing protein [Bremerella volcania]UBM35793.1 class I SAM-dependent methyltransferase [Bremerella volcania]
MAQVARTDQAWKQWGDVDPYYGVLTDEKYRGKNLGDAEKDEFFASGRERVDYILQEASRFLGRDFQPQKILDYGCGVGRLALAFADRAAEVTGIDVSEGMLREAEVNAQRLGTHNIQWLAIDGTTLPTDEQFDFVHSFIVFQHIRPQQGLSLFQQLVERIRPGGIGAIQLTYSRSQYAEYQGLPSPRPSAREIWRRVWLNSPVRRHLKAMLGKPVQPEMEMNAYHLNQVFFLLQSIGIDQVHTEFTNHGGHLGVSLMFAKPSAAGQVSKAA